MTREEAIDGVKKIKNYLCAGNPMWDTTTISEVLDMAIFALESYERKTGKWIKVDDADDRISGRCSLCGWEAHLYEDDVVGMDYCPNCGADMRGDIKNEQI